jgi:sugar/nucleoside kinase (ribokinase family)
VLPLPSVGIAVANGWGVAVASEKVVGLGLCVIDHVYVVERLDFAETRIRFTQRLVLPGGMIGTAISQAAMLGCEAHLLSMLGDDADGRFVRRSIEEIGVKTERLVISPDAETTVAVVLVEQNSGERRFIVPDRRALERDAPDFDLTAIDSTTTVLVDGHFPEQALRAVEKAREVGASVVGDFHRPSPAVRKLLPYVDFPVVPLEFAELISAGDPQRAMFEMADQFGGTPVVTLGAEGGLYLEEGRVRRFAAQPVAVVDTTGAGDVFHGAFAAGLSRGWTLERTIELATRAAALCCTALGGAGRLMTREESLAEM